MKAYIREMTSESHLRGHKNFRVIHGKSSKESSVGLHRHEFAEIMWIREGEGTLIANGKTRAFSKNFLYIAAPNEIHVLEPAKNSFIEFSFIAVRREVMENFINFFLDEDDDFGKRFMGISVKLSSFEISFLDRAAVELAWQDDSLFSIYRFLINLYWQMKNAFVSALPSDMPDWLLEACQRIRDPENLKEGLAEFRKICGKDMSYVNRSMKKHMNCTPTEYINDARLRYAKWILETSSFSISEISDLCGFSDLAYFCRKFKGKYDSTPGEARRNPKK